MIIREIKPAFPPDCQVSGFLYECDVKHEQGEDMLDVVLPNGILVSAGWYPDGDPSGSYCVLVYRGYERLIPVIESKTVDEAAAEIERCVRQFRGRNLQAVNDSESTFSTV